MKASKLFDRKTKKNSVGRIYPIEHEKKGNQF